MKKASQRGLDAAAVLAEGAHQLGRGGRVDVTVTDLARERLALGPNPET
jgi:hypothetical protein